jgi:hypothetical protein
MKEKYEDIEFYIDKAITMREGKNILIFGYTIIKHKTYYQSDSWYGTEQQAREAAIEYITDKMQNGER